MSHLDFHQQNMDHPLQHHHHLLSGITISSAGIILSSPAPSVIPRSAATLSADAISLSLANVCTDSAKS